MLHIYTGRNHTLAPALIEALRTSRTETSYIVVPRQLTLQTERMLLAALADGGSFKLQVITAARLCQKIFESAGQPEGERVDDRGRVLLVKRAVASVNDQLTIYRNMAGRRGFCERCADQLERFRQASLDREALESAAEELAGTTRMKLNDLARILEAYEALSEGRYLDGEREFRLAIEAAPKAEFLHVCDLWFFGFDMVPPTLHAFAAALAAMCPDVAFFLPMENDPDAPDADVFQPIAKSLDRLVSACLAKNAAYDRVYIEEEPDAGTALNLKKILENASPRLIVPASARQEELKWLSRELYALHPRKYSRCAHRIQMARLRNPREECQFAAALCRRLCWQRGWKHGDLLILCEDIDNYAAPLKSAFDACGIPLFLSVGRSAARHRLSECLLSALAAIEKGYPQEEMLALLATGLTPLSEDESERLRNFAFTHGLRGTLFTRPLRRGTEAERVELEPLRQKSMAPLISLRNDLRQSKTLADQLAALYNYLVAIGAPARSRDRMDRLSLEGLREVAGEEGQVWNRILGAMDQMHALMGETPLTLSELRECLFDSLSAIVIKALPQSEDAVFAQGIDAACTRTAKAVIILGASERMASGDESLLTAAQSQQVCRHANVYLGPTDTDLARLRKYYVKCALEMASDYVAITCSLSGTDGAAQSPDRIFDQMKALFEDFTIVGGLMEDPRIARMLRATPRFALALGAQGLSATLDGQPLTDADSTALRALAAASGQRPDISDGLRKVRSALRRPSVSDQLNPATARALYGELQHISVTRLEKFAACPFSYFVQYGLKPEVLQEYVLTPLDEGTFFHECVQAFVLESRQDLHDLSAESAASRMDKIADAKLDQLELEGPLGDTSVTLAQRRSLKAIMRQCAAALAWQMRGSAFRNTEVEQKYEGAAGLMLPESRCLLEGKIDRIDEWDEGALRILDYKRNGKKLRLDSAYYGLRLQLPLYLAIARRGRDVQSAGFYYFPVKEGIVQTQSTDPSEVEEARFKEFHLDGLLPSDDALLEAMSPNYAGVFGININQSGAWRKGTLDARQADYEAVTRHAIQMADQWVARIRAGQCAISPCWVGTDTKPCEFCEQRPVCHYEDRLDSGRTCKKDKLKDDEALARIKYSVFSENPEDSES